MPERLVVNSTSNSMWVLFESDYSNTGRGFSIQLWSYTGELDFNLETSNNTNCGQNVTVPETGKSIEILKRDPS